jgi:hypothetical protein
MTGTGAGLDTDQTVPVLDPETGRSLETALSWEKTGTISETEKDLGSITTLGTGPE